MIAEVYKRFLVESGDQEELAYATLDQEIEVNLIHRNYVSRKDIDICLAIDINTLRDHPNFGVTENLHDNLRQAYADPAEPGRLMAGPIVG